MAPFALDPEKISLHGIQNSSDILPGGPSVLAATGQFTWIGKSFSRQIGEYVNIALVKDEIGIHGSYEVGGGEAPILSLARGLAELRHSNGLNRCSDIFLW
jgi:hypothetical protein